MFRDAADGSLEALDLAKALYAAGFTLKLWRNLTPEQKQQWVDYVRQQLAAELIPGPSRPSVRFEEMSMEPIDFAELSRRVDALLHQFHQDNTSYLVECDCWNHRQGDDVYRFAIYVALPEGFRVEASTFEEAFHLVQRELISRSRIGLFS